MRKVKRIVSIFLIALMVAMAVPYTAHASTRIYCNSSYSAASGNSDSVSLPSGTTTFYYKDSFYLNLQVGADLYIQDATVYVYKDGSLYHSANAKRELGFSNYIRYWGHPLTNVGVGSYYFYFVFTYSNGSFSSSTSTHTTKNYSFNVIDRTPTLSASSTNVSLNLSGTNTKDVSFTVSCATSYGRSIAYSKNSSAFSCAWQGWEGNTDTLRITGISDCSNEPVTVSLKKKSDSTVVATKTIYVTVTGGSYTLSYNANGGNGAPSNQTGAKSYNISSTVPKKFGYTFLGWSKSSSATSATYKPGDSISLSANTTLYAVWKSAESLSLGSNKSVTISFAYQERYYTFQPSSSGSYVFESTGSLDVKAYLYSSSGTELKNDDDSGEGRNFKLEYNLSSGSTYYIKVYALNGATGSSTFSVKKKTVSHTVTYNYSYNGGTSATKTSATVAEGAAIDLTPTAKKDGWTFVGWNTDSSATTGLSLKQMGASDVPLYAIFKKTLTGTFIDYSGTTKTTRTVTTTIYNRATSGTVSAPTQNTYSGWTKRGWGTGTAADASTVSSFSISKDTPFYGLYKRTLTLSYNANGGSPTPSSQTATQYTNSYNISNATTPSVTLSSTVPRKTNYEFVGWAKGSTSGPITSPGKPVTISSDTTMYAVWEPVKTHTVTYNYSYNGGSSATKTSATVAEGAAIDLTPIAKKEGWTFVGWNTDSSATTGLSSKKMGTSNITLYAIFKKTLTGTFVDYSGTTKTTRTVTTTIYNRATSGTVSAPTQNTYSGWTKRGWGTGTAADASTVSSFSISKDTTFYGLYKRTLTLSYDANGGSSTPSKQTETQYTNSYSISKTKNPIFTLASAIKKTNSSFVKWAKDSTTGTKYDAGSNIEISKDTTMYATWKHEHTFKTVTEAPTCTKTGKQYDLCTDCGARANEKTLPKAGHSYGNWITERKATCAQTGLQYRVCSKCGDRDEKTISKTSHSYKAVRVEPTCTKSGSEYKECTVCGNQTTKKTIAKTGHSYGSWIVERNATCQKAGLEYQVCANCGERREQAISKKSHSYKTVTEPATCTKTGSEYQICTVCGTKANKKTLAKTDHVYGDVITERKATCTRTGLQYQICSNCGERGNEKTIPKKKHSYNTVTEPATCTETGLEYQVCKTCGEKVNEKTLPKAAHKYKKKSTVATLKKDGKTYSQCTVCGKVKKGAVIPKIATLQLSQTVYTYDGTAKNPKLIVKDSEGKPLKNKKDYNVKYAPGRTECGVYNVKVTFKGNYSGEKTLTFRIELGQVTGLKQTKGQGVKFKWNPVEGATYYEIYCKDKKMDDFQIVEKTEGNPLYKKYGDEKLHHKNISEGTVMKFKVRAVRECADGTVVRSDYSKVLTATAK